MGSGGLIMKLDPRPRCRRCGKLPRGKLQKDKYTRHDPFCSFHCQESARMDGALRAVRDLAGHVAAPNHLSEEQNEET